jgi:glycosyltransferase involved in cell wall biosynthesis
MLGIKNKLNVVFFLCIPFPLGMAGTKRIQHAVDGLRSFNNVDIRVVITRQVTTNNPSVGNHKGVPFQTLLPDALGWKGLLRLPKLYARSYSAVKGAYQHGAQNVLYVYGAPSIDNMSAIFYGRRIGYQIVFDIVEDDNFAPMLLSDWLHNFKLAFIRFMTPKVIKLSDGIVVISSHLYKKFIRFTKGKIPIHHRSISIDPDLIKYSGGPLNSRPAMFYAGSFGVKDNIIGLLDAFDSLATRHSNLRLVMTGKGSPAAMDNIFTRIATLTNKERLEYRGFLDDKNYYKTLAEVDIPCMTRKDIGYAHAGFPFKLGEFLATGRPVIASRISDVEEYLIDRYNALLVHPGCINDIIESVEFLLNNKNASLDIGERGRELALLHWDYRTQGHALYKFLKGLYD